MVKRESKKTVEVVIPSPKKDYFELRLPKTFPKTITANTFLIALLIVSAFLIGTLYTRVQYLEKNQAENSSQVAGVLAPSGATPQPTEDLSPKNVSVDDDPVFGDKNAPLTLIEFSDYECPFCKSFYEDTLPQLKKDYIDTGKVKLVYRDMPLGFHENAHKEAQAAECAREQGGDEMYFRYHDEIFKRTTSNGTGLALEQLPVIASEIGIDTSLFQQCLDSEKLKAEVDKDISDAGLVNANSTPSFFVGKVDSKGVMSGTPIIGAQPYAVFKQLIEQKL
jgi:protein-disulfide isomerase